jgi:predicted kinase
MVTLTIMRGISGSGKSTMARQMLGMVVSRDDIRVMLYGKIADTPAYYRQDKKALSVCENRVTIAQDAMVAGYLRAGIDTIVDNTNIEWSYVKSLAKIGYRHGAEVVVKVIDVPLDVALARDFQRGMTGGRTVGTEVIQKQYERFKSNKHMLLEPVFSPKPYNGTPGKPPAVLCDLDGTLADFKGVRGPFDTNVENDEVFRVIADLVLTLDYSNEYRIIFMSGRKEAARGGTERWLEKHVTTPEHLFMRADSDNRPDNLVKADLFDEHVRDNFDVQFVLDDRDQVVNMWRRMGITCLQVAEGNF